MSDAPGSHVNARRMETWQQWQRWPPANISVKCNIILGADTHRRLMMLQGGGAPWQRLPVATEPLATAPLRARCTGTCRSVAMATASPLPFPLAGKYFHHRFQFRFQFLPFDLIYSLFFIFYVSIVRLGLEPAGQVDRPLPSNAAWRPGGGGKCRDGKIDNADPRNGLILDDQSNFNQFESQLQRWEN